MNQKEFEQSQANLLQATLDLVNKPSLTNQQLLILLSQRLTTGEIKRELTQFGHYLMTETKHGIFKVDLHDGQLTEPNKERCTKNML
jgi:hypothetical protein